MPAGFPDNEDTNRRVTVGSIICNDIQTRSGECVLGDNQAHFANLSANNVSLGNATISAAAFRSMTTEGLSAASATIRNIISAPAASISELTAGAAAITRSLSAASVSAGIIGAATVTVSGTLSASAATVSGALTAGSAALSDVQTSNVAVLRARPIVVNSTNVVLSEGDAGKIVLVRNDDAKTNITIGLPSTDACVGAVFRIILLDKPKSDIRIQCARSSGTADVATTTIHLNSAGATFVKNKAVEGDSLVFTGIGAGGYYWAVGASSVSGGIVRL